MRELNNHVYIIDESLVYTSGKYNVSKDLPEGEYYIWGNKVYYEYTRNGYYHSYRNEYDGYAVFENNDIVTINSGTMTPVENIGYINENTQFLYPKHVYRTKLEIPTGYYLFRYDEKDNAKEHSLKDNKCNVDLYKAIPFPLHLSIKGEYGCFEIRDDEKHIVITNGIAKYYGQSKFDEIQILDNSKLPENQLYATGKEIYNDEIIDMKLFFKYRKGGRFCGKITVDVVNYYWYIINGKCKWKAKIHPFFGQWLEKLSIKFKTNDGSEEIKVFEGHENIRSFYNYKDYKGYYIISTELPNQFYGKELQLSLIDFNGIETNELLEDYKNIVNYIDESDISSYFKDDFIQFRDVLNRIEGINAEQELKLFNNSPEIIRLILPALNEIANVKQKFNYTNEKTNKDITFVVKSTYDKAFYCIAKLADQAKEIYSQADGDEFVIIYDSKQVDLIKMTYYIFSHEETGYIDEAIEDFLQKNCCEYYVIHKVNDCISMLQNEYGYRCVYRDSLFRNIIKNENNKMRTQVDKIYSDIVKEKRVPTKWSNEFHLFSLISMHNSNAQYQYHCEWLGQQSLDIYIPESKIGIEYQGKQHYMPVEIWGGEDSLEKNQERDSRKRKLCEENEVTLLEWKYTVPVNNENVIKFMQDNDIPFIKNNENHIEIRTEMAPVLVPKQKKKTKKAKTNRENVKNYIVQYDLTGNYVNKFCDIGSASKAVGVSSTSISKVLRGERNSAAGYIWRRIDANEKIPKNIIVDFDVKKVNSGKPKKIAQLNSTGVIIQEFESISDATRKTGISLNHIKNELMKFFSDEWTYIN